MRSSRGGAKWRQRAQVNLAEKGRLTCLFFFEKIRVLSTFNIRDSSNSPEETCKVLGLTFARFSKSVHRD